MITTIKDEEGNKIIADEQGANITITLQLKDESRSRKVGVVNKPSRVLLIKRNRSKHLHHKSNSYGFNYTVVSTGKQFDNIRLEDEYDVFVFPKQILLNSGRFLFFKQVGFERQIFFRLEDLAPYKVKSAF